MVQYWAVTISTYIFKLCIDPPVSWSGVRKRPRVHLLPTAQTQRQRTAADAFEAHRIRDSRAPGSQADVRSDRGARTNRFRQSPRNSDTPGNAIDLTGMSDEDEVVLTSGVIQPSRHSRPDFASWGTAQGARARAWESLSPMAANHRPVAVAVASPPVEKPCAVCLDELKAPACGPCGCVPGLLVQIRNYSVNVSHLATRLYLHSQEACRTIVRLQ